MARKATHLARKPDQPKPPPQRLDTSFTWPEGVEPTVEFQAALEFAARRQGDLFITGRAGTGKSTLLRALRAKMGEGVAVLAPTGLAGVNVGGQTIHSFFGLPPRLIGPGDIRKSRNGAIMRRLDTLIIDEVSMVRSDLMNAIDAMLRLNRGRSHEPFGGVQLLLFGDLHQLPPVVSDPEAQAYLSDNFGGPFFFNAPSFRDGRCDLLELSQVFRQSDPEFIRLLNSIREGQAGESELAALNDRVRPLSRLRDAGEQVILTTTNEAANRINQAFLTSLPGTGREYTATLTGEYPETARPTDPVLTLKIGAKVIMIRNDPQRRWVNGTLARVASLEKGSIGIEIGSRTYQLEPVAWESVRYSYDTAKDAIVPNVTGTFQQLPVRLAWALTIHKAQGLTLDQVYIDLGRGAFAHGQTYVALSRCRSLEGLALARPLRARDIVFDSAATGYRDLFAPLGMPGGGRLF